MYMWQSRVEIIPLRMSTVLPHLKCCSAVLPLRAEFIPAIYVNLSGIDAASLHV